MNSLNITPEELAIIQAILQQYVPNLPVWAFGSRVKGKARPYSDLDLAIITQSPMSFSTYGDLKDAFEESDLVWKVDIVDWASTSEQFQEMIKQKYVVIQ